MDNMTRFKDKIIFITGGTSGIGLATAVQFVIQGAQNVIVCGRRQSKWEEAQNYIQKLLTKEKQQFLQYLPCDVRVEQQVKVLIKKIFDDYGRLDVCFNNAGVQPGEITGPDGGFIGDLKFDSSLEADGSIIYRVPSAQSGKPIDPSQTTAASPVPESEIATSCLGVFYSLKWQIYYLFEQQPKNLPASIINTSSRNGVLPDAHRPLYAASKAFILALTRSVANQVAQKAVREKREMIRVNAISPGPIDTPLEFAAYGATEGEAEEYHKYVAGASAGVPMQRTGQPEEIAPAVLFLADDKTASYITGSNICVDGGHTGSPLLYPNPIKK